jgi:hypothetical protein
MTNCERKAFIRDCCNKLLAQEWTDFTVGQYTRRNSEINYDDYRNEELIHKRAKKQVAAGELSKALKTLKSDRRVIPLNHATLELLKSKFPDPCIHDVPENEIMQTSNFSATADQKFIFDEQYMRKMILSMPKTTAPGLDKCRSEFIATLWSPFRDDREHVQGYRFSLTQICILIANAEIPEEIAPFFRDIAEIALPKGEENLGPITDLRPIGLQLSLKKLVNKCQMHETETKNNIQTMMDYNIVKQNLELNRWLYSFECQ